MSLPRRSSKSTRSLHITPTLSRLGGGIPPVVWGLTEALRSAGSQATSLCLKDIFTEPDNPSHSLHQVEIDSKHYLHKSRLFIQTWTTNVPNVLHYHGVWHPLLASVSQAALANDCPLIIAPHGMLEPWTLRVRAFKKMLALATVLRIPLVSATCFHALCNDEAESIRRLGFKQPIAIVPNGITPPITTRPSGKLTKAHNQKKMALFLGRITPKKGLLMLISAWSELRKEAENWQLLIRGPDENGHTNALHQRITELRIRDVEITIGPPAYGREKEELLAKADLFILPSYSEGFSMAILEAMAFETPVLATTECHFPAIEGANAGFVVPPFQASLRDALRSLLQDTALHEKGLRAKELVHTKYTWASVARSMTQLYNWISSGLDCPSFVTHD